MDNTWLHQTPFYNTNFTRKQPNKNHYTHLTPTFYGLPDRCHAMKWKDFYQNLTFKSPEQLETLTGTKMIPLHFNNLKAHITKQVGNKKKYDALVKEKLPKENSPSVSLQNSYKTSRKGLEQ